MKHHPDIALLLEYVSGQISPSLALAIGLHQNQCTSCQQTINELESLGGQTLESVATNSVTIDNKSLLNFDQLMAEIDEETSSTEMNTDGGEYDQLAVSQMDLPLLDRLANQDFSSISWQRIGLKIWRSQIAMNDSGFNVELLKFLPKAKIPKHTHRGNEFTLVLQGDFSDHSDRYRAGEFIVQNQTHEHQPVAGDSGCICLAITDAPLRFTGTFGPLLNWFNR